MPAADDQPGAESAVPETREQEPTDTEEGDEFKSYKNGISDPAGTQNLPGAPNYQHGFLDTKKGQKKKVKRDPFESKISEVLKFDEFTKRIMQNLKDKKEVE